MGTAIGPVITYLVDNAPAALQAVDPDVVVVDGWATDIADRLFFVGRTSPDAPQAESGAHSIITLGNLRVDEEFTIPCFVDVWTGGSDQAESRNAAIAIFDAFVEFLRSDRTLGGALQGGYYAQITNHSMDQTNDPAEAEAGRRCLISFSLHCQNRY